VSTPVNPLGPTLPGPPDKAEEIVLTLSVGTGGDVCWWVSKRFGQIMTAALAREIVATLEHFLKDFIRQRG